MASLGTTTAMAYGALLASTVCFAPRPPPLFAARPALRARVVAGTPYEQLTVGVVKERKERERRVAQSPESVALLVKKGFRVVVEQGAGADSLFGDDAYVEAGATVASREEAWGAHFITKINPPTREEAKLVGDRTLLAQINPSKNTELVAQLAGQGATVFALDMIPRLLSRGQTCAAPDRPLATAHARTRTRRRPPAPAPLLQVRHPLLADQHRRLPRGG